MSQISLAELHQSHTHSEAIPDAKQWVAAIEATVFAVALLKQKLKAGERAAELESYAYAQFQQALDELAEIRTSSDGS